MVNIERKRKLNPRPLLRRELYEGSLSKGKHFTRWGSTDVVYYPPHRINKRPVWLKSASSQLCCFFAWMFRPIRTSVSNFLWPCFTTHVSGLFPLASRKSSSQITFPNDTALWHVEWSWFVVGPQQNASYLTEIKTVADSEATSANIKNDKWQNEYSRLSSHLPQMVKQMRLTRLQQGLK